MLTRPITSETIDGRGKVENTGGPKRPPVPPKINPHSAAGPSLTVPPRRRRKGELGRKHKDLDFKKEFSTDDYGAQRGLAQWLNDKFKPALDKIRDIDPNNPSFKEYQRKAEEFLKKQNGGM